jgi:hypothetical protein
MMSVLRYFAQLHFWSYCVFCASCRETIGWRFGSFYSFLEFPSVTLPCYFLHSCSPTETIVDLSPSRPSNSHTLLYPFEWESALVCRWRFQVLRLAFPWF